jgi:2-keto-4-pentenoate hydratase
MINRFRSYVGANTDDDLEARLQIRVVNMGVRIRDLIDETDVASAYAIQEKLTADRLASGVMIVGRKIGLTNPAVQAQLGVDRPDFGVLFDDMGAVVDRESRSHAQHAPEPQRAEHDAAEIWENVRSVTMADRV